MAVSREVLAGIAALVVLAVLIAFAVFFDAMAERDCRRHGGRWVRDSQPSAFVLTGNVGAPVYDWHCEAAP